MPRIESNLLPYIKAPPNQEMFTACRQSLDRYSHTIRKTLSARANQGKCSKIADRVSSRVYSSRSLARSLAQPKSARLRAGLPSHHQLLRRHRALPQLLSVGGDLGRRARLEEGLRRRPEIIPGQIRYDSRYSRLYQVQKSECTRNCALIVLALKLTRQTARGSCACCGDVVHPPCRRAQPGCTIPSRS
jgi:hypothetical protein